MKQRRTVFFVSDQTGVTAETMGHSLLTQFDGMDFRPVTLPFISTVDKAREAVAKIDQAGRDEGAKPVVFATLVDAEVRDALKQARCLFLDFFDAFLGPLELELGRTSAHVLGRTTRAGHQPGVVGVPWDGDGDRGHRVAVVVEHG